MNAIEVTNLSKKFKITHGKEDTLKGRVLSVFRKHRPVTEEFWALKDVSFKVKKGETMGIIGSNGSGKTTLLRILAGILYPDQGGIKLQGKISTLFELGTGFHPELTGRENIYLNGAILGLKKREIDQKFDQILTFSELEDFIDTPLKFYSSGMHVRLAFSIAINVNPEILLVDEVLAVGDSSFQQKSFSIMQNFKKKGVTIVIVTHDLNTVQEFCDRAIFLKKGDINSIGNPNKVILDYMRISTREQQKNLPLQDSSAYLSSDRPNIIDVKCSDENGKEKLVFDVDDSMVVDLTINNSVGISPLNFGVSIFREDGTYCYGTNTIIDKFSIPQNKRIKKIRLKYDNLSLLSGSYYLVAAVFGRNEAEVFDFKERVALFKILGPRLGEGVSLIKHKWYV